MTMTTCLKTIKNALVGVISDTHGILKPEAVKVLHNADMIIHAGDIGNQKVLDELREIAPLTAVKGNMDSGSWSRKLPETDVAEIGNVILYVIHDINGLDLDPSAAGIGAVISGHSYRPSAVERSGVLFLNPGSASYPTIHYPASLALLHIQERTLNPKFIKLKG